MLTLTSLSAAQQPAIEVQLRSAMAVLMLGKLCCGTVSHAPRTSCTPCSGPHTAAVAASADPCCRRKRSSWARFGRPALCRQLSNTRHSRSRRNNVRAPCSYGGGASSAGAGGVTAEATSSPLIQKEVVLFLIQLDYDKQLQRALNYDNFEAASEIRKRREQLDEAVDDFQASKGPGDGARDARQTQAADFASEGLRLRSEMQRAAEEERYTDASALRDRLNALQKEAEAAAQATAEQRCGGERCYRLGQRVLHARHGYRGIVCGWDVRCCEDAEWRAENGVESLSNGAAQAFYHVLVDLRDWEGGNPQSAIAYVPEELLGPPETSETWGAQHGDDASFVHPYAGMLFLGSDHAGDFLPGKPLRQKYSAQRRDVGPPGDEDEADGTEETGGNGGPDSGGGGGGFGGPDSSGDSGSGPSGLDLDGPGGGMTIM